MKNFSGKLCLVTGGSSGIGLALAKKLSALGAHVWIIARNQAALNAALQEITHNALNANQIFGALAVDISKWDALQPILEEFTRHHGVPDLLINNAGICRPGLFTELSPEIFHQLMDINFMGMVHVTKCILPGMIQRQSGYIVNVSSLAGLAAVVGYSAYGATKFAVRGFTDGLKFEYKPDHIHFSVVFPPDTQTPGLEADKPFLPALTRQMNADFGGEMSAEAVAQTIIDGIRRQQYMIIPGVSNQLMFHAYNLFGYRLVDLLVDFSRNRLNRKTRQVR